MTQTGRWSERIDRREPVVQVQIGRPPLLSPLRWRLDMALGLRHAAWAAAHATELDARPWAAVFQRLAPAQAPDVDEDLYGGFIGPDDRPTLEAGCFDVVVAPSAHGSADAALRLLPLGVRALECGSG